MMMSCKEAARLVSEQRDRPLRMREKLALRFHLAMCRMCTLYKKNLEMLGRISRGAGEWVASERTTAPFLSAEAKQRIRERLSRTT